MTSKNEKQALIHIEDALTLLKRAQNFGYALYIKRSIEDLEVLLLEEKKRG